MGAGHGHRVHYHGHSPLHRARPERKVLAVVALMLVVVVFVVGSRHHEPPGTPGVVNAVTISLMSAVTMMFASASGSSSFQPRFIS